MRVAVGFDHAGFPLRETVVAELARAGHDVIDCGTDSEQSVDYPVHAARAAKLVSDGTAERAVLACGSGIGVSIVANKLARVRAVNARDPDDAEMSRRHNDANVLALAGRKLTPEHAAQIVETFFATGFEGGRHERRVTQISEVEQGELPGGTPTEAEEATR
ncbi:MAG: ribose 5-phosphate isomerase B [Solirubrobacterales bacterium]